MNGTPWYMTGASIYNPGLRPAQSGLLNPAGTVALAQRAGLNTIRLVNYFSDTGVPESTPYAETAWVQVDQMIADAGAAGLHVDLDLSDYRNILWNNCVNPYTHDWTQVHHLRRKPAQHGDRPDLLTRPDHRDARHQR